MSQYQPLLSICIPTYNRAEYLKQSLDSLVCLPEFLSGNIDVVISDNASTDNTEIMIKEFVDKHSCIHYFKNEENIRDKNFPKVLSKACGVYRKLFNDTIIYGEKSLNHMLQVIDLASKEKPIIFWKNIKKEREIKYFENANLFLREASFWTTSIATFGLWQDDCYDIENKTVGSELSLWQTKYFFDLLAGNKQRRIMYVKDNMYQLQVVEKKDLSYGLYKVFYINYLKLVAELVDKKIIQKNVFDYLEKDLLFRFFTSWLVNYRLRQRTYKVNDHENLEVLVLNQYKNKCYYWKFLFKYKKSLLFAKLKNVFDVKAL